MPKSRYVASKRDIIIFFIISVFYTTLICIEALKPMTIEDPIAFIILLLFLYIPEIIVIIINAVIKYADINNEKGLKITKILFNIFAFVYFLLTGFLSYVLYSLLKSLSE